MHINTLARSITFLRISSLILSFICLSAFNAIARPTATMTAGNVVNAWLSQNSKPMNLKLGAMAKNVETYCDDKGNPVYHIVYLHPNGFVIVAGDDLVEPIVGFSAGNIYDPSPDSPLGALTSRDLASRVEHIREMQIEAQQSNTIYKLQGEELKSKRKWDKFLGTGNVYSTSQSYGASAANSLTTVSDLRVPAIIKSKWSQTTESSACYNYYSPRKDANNNILWEEGNSANYPCGCVATAMAQLMRHHQFPTAGIGQAIYNVTICGGSSQYKTTRGGDGNGGPYDWENMPLDPYSATTTVERQAIGALCYDAGISVNMNYCAGGSGAYMSVVARALRNTFGYNSAKRCVYNGVSNIPSTNRNAAINSNLNAGLPVILGITGLQSGNRIGHAIICDGYGYDSETQYHHLNMGWAGYEDAWYNLPAYHNYNIDWDTVTDVIYNVYPTESGEIISGRVLDANGNPIQGATVSSDSYTATTDSYGVYAITQLSSNQNYTISVQKEGYVFPSQNQRTGTSLDNSTSVGNLWTADFIAEPFETIITSSSEVTVPEGSTTTVGIKLGAQPSSSVTVTTAVYSGDSNISIQSGSSLIFTTSNWDMYQYVTLAAAQDTDAIDGTAVIRCSAAGYNNVDINAMESDDDKVILTSVSQINIPEGGTAKFGVKLQGQPPASVVVTTSNVSGDSSIYINSGSSLIFTTSNWDTYQYVTIAAAQDTDGYDGTATIRSSLNGWISSDVIATELDDGPQNIGYMKLQPDNTVVGVNSAAVSAVFGDSFYIQDTGRQCGIRVDMAEHSLFPNYLTGIIGTIFTDTANGERYIRASEVNPGEKTAIIPMWLSGKALGGGAWNYDSATKTGQMGVAGSSGLNNIGLLVRVTGIVSTDDEGYCVITDGSGLQARVIFPAGIDRPADNLNVAITGISSCYFDTATELLYPQLRATAEATVF